MNLDELKRKKLEELQAQNNEQEELQNQITHIESLAKQHLTKEALTRLGNLKIAHPEKAVQISSLITQLATANQIKEKINDSQLKYLLNSLQEKRDIKITRK